MCVQTFGTQLAETQEGWLGSRAEKGGSQWDPLHSSAAV